MHITELALIGINNGTSIDSHAHYIALIISKNINICISMTRVVNASDFLRISPYLQQKNECYGFYNVIIIDVNTDILNTLI